MRAGKKVPAHNIGVVDFGEFAELALASGSVPTPTRSFLLWPTTM